jgi:anti-sigma B factor antagonist
MSVTVRKSGKTTIIRVEGKLTLGETVEQFRARWSDALATGTQNIVLDLAEVPAIDSSGIGALVRCHAAVRGNGGKLKVVGAGEIVRHSFHVTHLDQVLDLHPDEESAMGALAAGSL